MSFSSENTVISPKPCHGWGRDSGDGLKHWGASLQGAVWVLLGLSQAEFILWCFS